jgi:7-cyano-7-deazaguanine synthase
MRKVVCLMSGGMDSATVLWQALSEGCSAIALNVRYGQRGMRYESEAVRDIVDAARTRFGADRVEALFVNTSLLRDLASGSALLNPTASLEAHLMRKGLVATVVPARNLLLVTIASIVAFERDATDVAIAVHHDDASDYPDTRPEFIEHLAVVVNEVHGKPLRLWAPLLYMTKADIVRRGVELGVPFELTRSCYDNRRSPCGVCDSCTKRAAAFAEVGVRDPLMERYKTKSKKGE